MLKENLVLLLTQTKSNDPKRMLWMFIRSQKTLKQCSHRDGFTQLGNINTPDLPRAQTANRKSMASDSVGSQQVAFVSVTGTP